jgi:tetratricopeptide (TPR) repeat protein
MEDGTPPPEPVTIERVCSTSQRAQAYTDMKGRFSFQMGQTAGVMQDATQSGSDLQSPGGVPGGVGMGSGLGTRQPSSAQFRLAGCDLRAVLPGYRSDTVNLAGRRFLDNPDVGTIVLHRLANVEGTVISMTSLLAPKDAKKAYDKGREALQKDKQAEAEKHFQKAVDLYPKYAAAWYELGRIQRQNQDIEQARKSYGNAVAADAKFLSPYVEMAQLAAGAQNWQELADTTDRVLRLDPVDYPAAYLYNAVANLNLGKMEAAEKSARAGSKLDAAHQYPKLEQALAMALARRKDYAGALAHLRVYLQFAPATEDKERIQKQVAELERLTGANQQANTEAAPQDAPGGPPQ